MRNSPTPKLEALEVAYLDMLPLQGDVASASIDLLFAEMDPIAFPQQRTTARPTLALPRAGSEESVKSLSYDSSASSIREKSSSRGADTVTHISGPNQFPKLMPDDFDFDINKVLSTDEIRTSIDASIDFDRDFEAYLAAQDNMTSQPYHSQQAVGTDVPGTISKRPCHSPAEYGTEGMPIQSSEVNISAPCAEAQATSATEPDFSWMDTPNPDQIVACSQQPLAHQVLLAIDHDDFTPEPDRSVLPGLFVHCQGSMTAEYDTFAPGTQIECPNPPRTRKHSNCTPSSESASHQVVSRAGLSDGDKTVQSQVSVTYPPDVAYGSRPVRNPTEDSMDIDRPNPRYKEIIHYTPLAARPRSWDCFHYNTVGELDPTQLYTPAEITRYLFCHPLHYGHNTRNSPLRMWIQRNPANSSNRYPSIYSHRCRFTRCPYRTINQGHYCVAFEEQTASNADHDPFISAGYVHLWCLERFCDLPRICAELNISTENRSFPNEPKGKNPMRLCTLAEEQAIASFRESCRSGLLSSSYPRYDQKHRPHEGTLTHTLAITKADEEPASVSRQREKRFRRAGYKGSSLTTHQGNLEIEATLRGKTRLHKNQNRLREVLLRRRTFFQDVEEEDANTVEKGEGIRHSEGNGREGHPESRQEPARYVPPTAQMIPSSVQPRVNGLKRGVVASEPRDIPYEPLRKRRVTASSGVRGPTLYAVPAYEL